MTNVVVAGVLRILEPLWQESVLTTFPPVLLFLLVFIVSVLPFFVRVSLVVGVLTTTHAWKHHLLTLVPTLSHIPLTHSPYVHHLRHHHLHRLRLLLPHLLKVPQLLTLNLQRDYMHSSHSYPLPSQSPYASLCTLSIG